jgi:hypothetical protein
MRSTRTIAPLAAALVMTSALAISATAAETDGAAEDAVIAMPAKFSGTLACGLPFGRLDGDLGAKTTDSVGEDGVERSLVNTIWRFPVVEMSDARLDGRVLGYQEGMDFLSDGDEIGVYSGLWHVTNDDGEWIGPYSFVRLTPSEYSTVTIRLDGQGGYQGLTAVVEIDWRSDCGWDVQGFILEHSLPEPPLPVTG